MARGPEVRQVSGDEIANLHLMCFSASPRHRGSSRCSSSGKATPSAAAVAGSILAISPWRFEMVPFQLLILKHPLAAVGLTGLCVVAGWVFSAARAKTIEYP